MTAFTTSMPLSHKLTVSSEIIDYIVNLCKTYPMDQNLGDISLIEKISPKLSKGQKTQIKIVKAAIICFAKADFESVSMESISKRAGVSRPLVKHYFSGTDEIFFLCVGQVRSEFQELVIAAMESESSMTEKLMAYVFTTFEWIQKRPQHVRLWMLFLSWCSRNKKAKRLNTNFVDIGHQRITAIIEIGNKMGEFKISNPEDTARTLQVFLTGILLSLGTEDRSNDLETIKDNTKKEVMRLLQVSALHW